MIAIFDPQPVRIEMRQHIQNLLSLRGLRRKDLAEMSGIDRVTISNILNNKQTFRLHQLDVITAALELPIGHFYDYFIAECCNDLGRLRPGKLGEFVHRCLEIGKNATIGRLMNLLLEDKESSKILTILFDIAETLYHSRFLDYSLAYYEKIISLDNRRSARLAIAHYRRFMIVRDKNVREQGREALYQLLEYLNQLPEEYEFEGDLVETSRREPVNLRFEGYRQALKMFLVFEEWGRLLDFAYAYEHLARKTNRQDALGEAMTYQIDALVAKGDYLKSLQIIEQLSILGEQWGRIAEGKKWFALISKGQYPYIEKGLVWAESMEEKDEMYPAALECLLRDERTAEADAFIQTHQVELDGLAGASGLERQPYAMRYIEARSRYYFAKGELQLALADMKQLASQASHYGNLTRLERQAEQAIRLLRVGIKRLAKNKDVPPSAKIQGTSDKT